MNKRTRNVLFSSEQHTWGTPPEIFEPLNAVQHFTLDAAASATNAKCPQFFDEATNAFKQTWTGSVWLNPEYGRRLREWVSKAWEESRSPSTTVTLLIPARTDTSFWHDYVMHAYSITLIRGRIHFINEDGEREDAAPFPSAVVVFKNTYSRFEAPSIATWAPQHISRAKAQELAKAA